MYIHFTGEQKQAARETDLVAFLQRRGEVLKPLRQRIRMERRKCQGYGPR